MSKIVIIGAGKTGRGYLARLLKESEKEICFVDKNETLVKELQEKKEFKIHFFGGEREDFVIQKYSCCAWEEAEFGDVSLILCRRLQSERSRRSTGSQTDTGQTLRYHYL